MARCEPVKMNDGSVLMVNLAHGEILTDEDRQILADFHGWLRGDRSKWDDNGRDVKQ